MSDRPPVGYTISLYKVELSETLTAQQLVAKINTCFKAFDTIITEHGIEKIKTIGDAYMAAGGLPLPQKGSAVRTVRAALVMQEFMRRYKAERDVEGKPAFEMRVGIHTGPVVAWIVGVKKFAYDIWGDTVNTASRMESSGEVGKVNISEATYALVRDVVEDDPNGGDVTAPRSHSQPVAKCRRKARVEWRCTSSAIAESDGGLLKKL